MKKIEYNKTDPVNRRATFGTEYPNVNLVFEKEDKYDSFKSKTEYLDNNKEKRFVRGKRMTFNLDNSTFRKIIFERSEFHDKHGVTMAEVSLVSFEDCDFKFTFFGGTIYKRVVFRRCTFKRCDFMNAEFEECTFNNCHFKDCTAYKVIFDKTEIDPIVFFSSIKVPTYNFSSLDAEEQKKIKRDWVEVKLSLSRQLVRSSSDVFNTDYFDQGLFLLKKSEFLKEIDKVRHLKEYYRNHDGIEPTFLRLVWQGVSCSGSIISKGLNLLFTKGGTSLTRLILTGVGIIIVVSIHLLYLNASYSSISLAESSSATWLEDVLKNIPYGMSLFLGFGYSGFNVQDSNVSWHVFYCLLGLAWYALLIQIIIRKIYR